MPSFTDLEVGGILPVASQVLEGTHQLAAKGGSISSLLAMNFNTSPRIVMLLDQTASPVTFSGTAVTPIWAYALAGLATNVAGEIANNFDTPLQFKNGLWVVMSTVTSTPFSCTPTGADAFFSATINLA